MKGLRSIVVVVFAIALSSVSFAGEGGTQDVSNLKYFVGEGNWIFNPVIKSNLSSKRVNIDTFSNIEENTDTFMYKKVGVNLGYGLMQNWSVGLATDYNIKDSFKRQPKTGDPAMTKEEMGFTSPVVGAKWRTQGDALYDYYLNWMTAFKTQRLATATFSGNQLTQDKPAGHAFELGMKWLMDGSSASSVWSINPYLVYALQGNWETKSRNFTTGSTFKASGTTEADITFGAELACRKHYDKFYTGLSANLHAPNTVTYKLSENVTEANGVATITPIKPTDQGSKVEINSPLHVTPKLILGYSVDQNMSFDLTVNYDKYKVYTVTSNSLGDVTANTNSSYKDISLALGLNYQM